MTMVCPRCGARADEPGICWDCWERQSDCGVCGVVVDPSDEDAVDDICGACWRQAHGNSDPSLQLPHKQGGVS